MADIKNKFRLRQKTLIIAGFLVTLLLITAIAIYIGSLTAPKVKKDPPALTFGSTSISKADYNKLVDSAKDQSVPEADAKDTINFSYKLKEAAKQSKLDVPEYLIAAQAQTAEMGNVYLPYDQLTDYEKIANYPKALFAAASLAETGGSIVSIFYAPYDTKTDAETNRVYAEDLAKLVELYKNGATDDKGNKITDPLNALLTPFTTDEHTHFEGSNNQSQVTALTSDGRTIRGSGEQYVDPEKLPVTTTPLDKDIFTVAQPLKAGQLSAVTKLSNKDAYFVIYNNKVYPKDAAMKEKLLDAIRKLDS